MKKNIKKVYLFSFFWMFLIIIPVIVPFFLDCGLTMKEVFWLQAIFGISVAILEVPSGYVCDLWGRKKTIILGAVFTGIGFTYLVFARSFYEFIIYELIVALSLSLVSGADISLLYDSVEELKVNEPQDEQYAIKSVANIQFSKVFAESIAAILGGILVGISFKSVLIAQAIVGWMPLIIALQFVEPNRNTMDKKKHLDNFKNVFKYIFGERSLLRLIFINIVVWGLSSFFAVWIFQKYWLDEQISLLNFGLLWALYNVTVGIVGKVVPSWEKAFGPIAMLVLMGVLPSLGYWGMSYFSGYIGVACGLLFQITRGITYVLLNDALNRRIPSEFRATTNSLVSLFFRLIFFVFGPLVGHIIDSQSMSIALNYLGAAYFLFFFVFMIPLILRVKNLDSMIEPDRA